MNNKEKDLVSTVNSCSLSSAAQRSSSNFLERSRRDSHEVDSVRKEKERLTAAAPQWRVNNQELEDIKSKTEAYTQEWNLVPGNENLYPF